MAGNGGGIFATLAYVNAMACIADETVFLFPSDDQTPDGRISEKVRQVPVCDPDSLAGKLSRILFRGILHRYERVFRELLDREHFDTVTFHNSKACCGLVDYAHAKGAKVITVHNNFERDYTVDNVSPLLLPFLLPPTLAAEKEAYLKSDLNLVLSENDRQLFRKRYGDHPAVDVLGVFEYGIGKPSLHEVSADAPVFVITGNLSAKQTLDSLLPWMDRYYPVLLDEVPGAKLIVAGKHPGERLKKTLDRPGVELVDTPADMSEVIARGRYYICPTCKGGGVKLRVMDGLREGLPVLCHAVSTRGYESFLDTLLYPYQDVDSFRVSLRRMLAGRPDVDSARRLYGNYFSFDAGKARLQEQLRRMKERSPRVLLLQEVLFQYRIPILEILRKRYDLEVACVEKGPGLEDGGIPVRMLPSRRCMGLKLVRNLDRLCRMYDAVIIQPHLSCPDFCLLPFRRNRRYRCLSWDIGIRASYRKKFSLEAPMDLKDRLYKRVMSHCEANLFYMPQMKDLWVDRGLDPSSLFVAHNTVATLDIPFNAGERTSFLFVGSLYPEKRVDLLLDAYENAFVQAGEPADFPVLDIVGGGSEEATLIRQAGNLRSGRRVGFHHSVFDEATLGTLFSKAIFCVSPHQAGLSVLKSFAYGTPFVTRIDAITGGEILNIRDAENGILYPEDAMLVSILTDGYRNREKFLSMGRNAYAYYRREASPAVMAGGIADALECALKKDRV